MNKPGDSSRSSDPHQLKLRRLTPEQVSIVDEYLSSVGEYGEVHLIVQRGELRYINKVVSFAARALHDRKGGEVSSVP